MQLHRNKWTLANMHDIDRQLYNIQLNAMINMQEDRRNKELFFKYSALLMATGMRRIEPFLRKVVIEKVVFYKHAYYKQLFLLQLCIEPFLRKVVIEKVVYNKHAYF